MRLLKIAQEQFYISIKPLSKTCNQFEIKTEDGSKVTGYTSGADFPNAPESPTRGEIFWIEVKNKGMGVGTSLLKAALTLMQKYGAKTVNVSVVTKSGEALVSKALKLDLIHGPLKESKSGKKEYEIA